MDITPPYLKRPVSPTIDQSTPTEVKTISASLKYIASNIDDATEDDHRRLDGEILEIFESAIQYRDPPKPHVLLRNIILLDPRLVTLSAVEVKKLLERCPSMEDMLQDAWESHSFKDIRRLEILWPRQNPQRTYEAKDIVSQRKAACNAWEIPYVSGTEILLLNTIRKMNKARLGNWKPYSNYFPIVQSSGTGKSRAVHELARHVFTLPFNFRADTDDNGLAYPPPDKGVRDYFTNRLIRVGDESFEAYRRGYIIFLANLFDQVRDVLKRFPNVGTYENLATDWRTYLSEGDNRQNLYDAATHIATNDLETTVPSFEEVNRRGETAARSLLKALDSLVVEPTGDDVRMILYFDEAHTLSDLAVKRPPGTLYDALTSAMDVFCEFDMFAITLSTKLDLLKFSPSPKLDHSARIVKGTYTLQAPFTELQFDCLEDGKPFFRPNEMTLAEVSKVDFLIKFGRPLFWTRWKAANNNDLRGVRDGMVSFARAKLVRKFNPKYEGGLDECARLAIFSTRLLLDFNPRREAATFQEANLVEGNMRIAYSVPKHREYLRSGTPSEPILAEAAALEMDALGRNIADVLIEIVNGGLISKGDMGGLTARTMFIMAYDAAAKKKCMAQKIPLTFSIPIHLFDFLAELFGETHLERILQVEADNDGKAGTFKKVFQHAFVRFTHFAVDGPKSNVSSHTTFAAIVRGMAIQCFPRQDIIDIVIPIVFLENLGDKLCEQMVSAILVQVTHRKGNTTLVVNEEALGRGTGFFPQGQAGNMKNGSKRPYITLVMQLGIQTNASRDTMHVNPALKLHPTPLKMTSGRTSQKPSRTSADHPRYAIFVSGCSESVYKVVHDKTTFAQLLEGCDLLDEHPRQDKNSITAVRRMKPFWEPGPECYDWIDDPILNAVGPVTATNLAEILLGVDAVGIAGLSESRMGFEEEEDPDDMDFT